MKIAAGLLLFVFLGFFVYYSNLRENLFESPKARNEVPVAGPVEARPKTYNFDISSKPPFHLSQLKGKVVYINFWASWCEPCRKEFPLIEKIKKEMGDQLEVVFINLDTPEMIETAKIFQIENAPTSMNVYENGAQLKTLFNVEVLPFHLVVDKEGRTAGAFYASLVESEKSFRSLLSHLAQE